MLLLVIKLLRFLSNGRRFGVSLVISISAFPIVLRMMSRGLEILSPAAHLRNSNWLFEGSKSTQWTPEENKQFENALALYDKDTPDRWLRVAAMIPGKTVVDVIKQYKELEEDVSDIEAGLIPIPGYGADSFTLEWANCQGFHDFYSPRGKRGTFNNQERKKGVPWTEEEHRQFLLGLKKYGKGDWRNISRNFVTSRTPTQVASHAQKYFIRQLTGGKDKRRSSIHDITTVNLSDTNGPPSPGTALQHLPNEGTAIVFDPTVDNPFASPVYGTSSTGLRLEQNFQRGSLQFGLHQTFLQMQHR